jgi:hypothetical protein
MQARSLPSNPLPYPTMPEVQINESPRYAVFSIPLLDPYFTPQYLECRSICFLLCNFLHSPLSSLPYTIKPVVQNMKLLIMQSSPFPCYLPNLNHNPYSADREFPHCIVFPIPLLVPSFYHNTWGADHESPNYAVISTPILSPSITKQCLEY